MALFFLKLIYEFILQASFDDSAKIVNLKLTHLPLIPKESVLAGL